MCNVGKCKEKITGRYGKRSNKHGSNRFKKGKQPVKSTCAEISLKNKIKKRTLELRRKLNLKNNYQKQSNNNLEYVKTIS